MTQEESWEDWLEANNTPYPFYDAVRSAGRIWDNAVRVLRYAKNPSPRLAALERSLDPPTLSPGRP